MTELEALRRVADAAQILAESCGVIRGKTPEDDDIWTVEIDHVRELNAALSALPAPAAEPEVVEVAVWVDPVDGDVQLARPGGKMDQMRLRFADWVCLGITRMPVRVPLPRVPEVVGEVEG